MTAVTRSGLWLAVGMVAGLGVFGCGSDPTPPGNDGGTTTEQDCAEDRDCPDEKLFFCNTNTSKCEPACRVKADCGADVRGEYALDYCASGLGCECDEGKCVGSLCSADSDCGSQVCRNGSCVAPPAASAVKACAIAPDLVVVKEGSKATFTVSAWEDAEKTKPVVVKEGATWTTTGPMTGSGSGNAVELTAGSATSGNAAVTAVTAAFGAVTCEAKAIVLPQAVPAGEVAVAVIDELSGRPVANADVLVSKADGSQVSTGATDARGYASLSMGGEATVSVSAFHADYSYLTIANYNGSGSRFLSLVVRRNQTDKYGGYKGSFGSTVPATSDVHVGIAGMALAGSITNLSLAQLLGPSEETDIKLGSIKQDDVPIPAGVYLGFGEQTVKEKFSAQGLASVCADEAKVVAGTCGTGTAWALAGDVKLGDLPIDAFTGGLDGLDYGAVLSRILPVFKKFNSSVVRDVSYELKTTPLKDGDYDFSDTTGFTSVNHDFSQIPMAFSYVVKLPELPKFKNAYVDAVAVIGGASVPARGVVPLGIGIAINQDKDGQTDRQADLGAQGLVQVRMAPTHHGLEGSEYGLVIAGLSTKSLTDASAGVGASAIYARLPGNAIAFDPKGTSPIDLSSQRFPAYPDGARFNFASVAQGLQPRSFGFIKGTSDLAGLNVLRVSFTDAKDHRWDVVMDPAQAATGFRLPAPTGTHGDRVFSNGVSTGERSTLLVQALRLDAKPATGGAPVDFKGYVEFNDTNAERTTQMLTAFSFIDLGRPSVSFKTPEGSPATIAKSSKVAVEVKNFEIGTSAGTDGVVKLSFAAGSAPVASCPDAILKTETTPGNGVLEYTLPANCSGDGLSMKAELLRIDETSPVLPAVSKTVTVSIE